MMMRSPLNSFIAAILALKFFALFAFLLSLTMVAGHVTTAVAKTRDACRGINLVAVLEVRDPAAYKAMLDDEAANWFNGNAKLWKVEKPGTPTSWLFGTAHLREDRILNLPAKAQAAFEQADTLVVEVKDLAASAQAAMQDPKLRERIFFTDGSTLSSHLSDEQEDAIIERISSGSTPWFLAKRMRPWVVMGLMTPSACENARQMQGVQILDLELQKRAEMQGKAIIGLESAKEQFLILSDVPFETQLAALKEVSSHVNMLDDMTSTLVDLYVEDRIGLIWPMLKALKPESAIDVVDAHSADFQRRVIQERNLLMAERSVDILARGDAFIAVGALHLPGKTGLVKLVRDQGYTVTAIKE